MDPYSRDAVLAECNFDWLRPAVGRLAALRQFHLSSCYPIEIPDILSGASSLREIYVSDRAFTHYSSTLVVPWAQITHFRGAYRTDIQRSILAAAHNLLQCALYFDDDGPYPDITMPCLRRLCVNESRDLMHITAPRLEGLFIFHASPIVKLLHFVNRSSCLLKKLILMDCKISSDLVTVLRDLPSLAYLLLKNHNNDATAVAELLEALTITGTSCDISPNLTTMMLRPGRNFPYEIFFHMAQTRFQAHPSNPNLERLRLDCPSSEGKIVIQKLRDEGFDVAVLDGVQSHLLKQKDVFVFNTTCE
ncbi:hypothetical protein DFH06DRAFT_661562 [Mycena polygramma]|nr:hypothetical protein DFH06DRAFT_661562 [Mycena polygramma]